MVDSCLDSTFVRACCAFHKVFVSVRLKHELERIIDVYSSTSGPFSIVFGEKCRSEEPISPNIDVKRSRSCKLVGSTTQSCRKAGNESLASSGGGREVPVPAQTFLNRKPMPTRPEPSKLLLGSPLSTHLHQ
eukprot:GHVN01087333.1.p1 GENE.GHVN01087333.1~~GHVN01087333.1.p1  ORF type:complete len:132 (-),score=0.33 GHVN01087333.1:109-504(-)